METRRKFLGRMLKGMCATSLVSPLIPADARAVSETNGRAHASAGSDREAMYYIKAGGRVVRCQLCPWRCYIADGERGKCGVRENRGGTCYTLVYGKPCFLYTDQIEKRPLWHYLPGTDTFSIATLGCNFGCECCITWGLSQSRPGKGVGINLPPQDVVRLAKENGAQSISFTQTEPVICYEYMLDVARLSKTQGIGTVMVSNGYIQKEPMKELSGALSAVKIDLKSFDEDFYRKICHGELRPVLDTMVLLKEIGIWFEIVVLLISTLNDSPQEIRKMCQWVKTHIGVDVPMQFIHFRPAYKLLHLPPTPYETLLAARNIAADIGINYAYVGGFVNHLAENTHCPRCKQIVVHRTGHVIKANKIVRGGCSFCGCQIPGVWNISE